MDNKEFFDAYSNYADFVMEGQGEVYRNTKFLLDKYLKKAQRVLDIGNGGVINYDYKHLDKLDCLDVSISHETTQKYKVEKNISFIVGDALDLQLESNSYDFVIIQYVLHHLVGDSLKTTKNNIKKCVEESLRVLNRNGKLLIIEPVMPHILYKIEAMLFRPLQLFCKIIKHGTVFQYSMSEIESVVCSTELGRISKMEEINPGKRIMVFKTSIPSKMLPLKVHMIEISKNKIGMVNLE